MPLLSVPAALASVPATLIALIAVATLSALILLDIASRATR